MKLHDSVQVGVSQQLLRWALACACATLLAFAGVAHGATVPQSYGFSDNVWGYPDISQQTSLDAFASSHAKYVRTQASWQWYEPTQGAYSASYLVWLYQEYQALLANGQTPVFTLLGTPYWALTD